MTVKNSNAIEAAVRDALVKQMAEFSGNAQAAQTSSVKEKVPEKSKGPFTGERRFETKDKIMFSKLYGFMPEGGIPDFPVTVYKRDQWSSTMKAKIPDVSKFDAYMPVPKYLTLLQYCVERGLKPLVFGPPASGKSSIQEFICAKTNKPFVRIQGKGDMESASMIGSMGVDNGSTVWHDGLITQAVREGAHLLLDEGFAIPAEIMMALQWLREKGGKLVLDDKHGDDKVVEPAKSFSMVIADNTRGMGDNADAFAGVAVQNTAGLNRLQMIINMDYPGELHDRKVVAKMLPEIHADYRNRMVQLMYLIHKAYDQGEVSLNMSLRTIDSWGQIALDFQSLGRGFILAYRDALPLQEERDAVASMYQTVFGDMCE